MFLECDSHELLRISYKAKQFADSEGNESMKSIKQYVRIVVASAITTGVLIAGPTISHAAQPVVQTDDGAFVKLLGNPAEGTAKFQFGWTSNSAASDAAGYWVGLYDVTHSHYVWSFDTGATDQPEHLLRNARPTSELPSGEYKVVFFVRETYTEPVTNISEIELPFMVINSDD